jgi:5-methylcytosine-specific restriction endonuclease McrA
VEVPVAELKDLDILDVGNTIQLVGAIYSSPDKTYLCFLPGETAAQPQEVLEMSAADWQQFLEQTDLLNVQIDVQLPNGAMVKAITRKSQRQIDAVVSWSVFRRDGFKCRYCGCDYMPLTVDHLILWEEGGPSVPENLVAACKKCNKTRGNKQLSEWLDHPHYKRVSQRLSEAERFANQTLLYRLDQIKRVVHQRAR